MNEGIDNLNPIHIKPPIKWAGGKRWLVSKFSAFFPKKVDVYAEPFLGGGAVFFYLLPQKAFLIDNNEELINFYIVVRDKLEELIEDLKKHKIDAEYYYQIRSLNPALLSNVERASRFLYLNKTGYNGLWRVNKHGQYNVPFGRYNNPRIADYKKLYMVSLALKNAYIRCGDFSSILEIAEPGMFVYMDPPYQPLSRTANFTSYTPESFNENDQLRLAQICCHLHKMGCMIMISNSDTPLVRQLYAGFNITTVTARRTINCRSDRRGSIKELIIRNYD